MSSHKLESLHNEMKKLTDDGNYFMASKELYNILLLTDGEEAKRLVNYLYEILNGELGRLYKALCSVETLLFDFNNYNKLSYDELINELDTFIDRLCNVYDAIDYVSKNNNLLKLIKEMENIPKRTIYNEQFEICLKKIRNEIWNSLQKDTFELLKKQGINFNLL